MGTPADLTIRYSIDRHDRIAAVSENWEAFAQANGGAAVVSGKVLGRSLWEFIQDRNVRQLYRHLVDQARGGRPLEFRYRCDSPTERRVFLMRVRAIADGGIEFSSELQSATDRSPVGLLDAAVARSAASVRICSWCQRIAVGAEEWVEAEAAVDRLGLLQTDALPALTHGICPTCYDRMTGLLEGKPSPS